ncbi:MAG: hypothetical protein AB1348_06855 [Nitrospirota bacterium]
MDKIEKLKRLLHFWMEHNNEHAKNYKDWAEKVSSSGNPELSKILYRLYDEASKLNKLFEEAIKKIG